MKKIIFGIITTFIIFSIEIASVEAKTKSLEEILNLNYWPVIYDLTLEKLDNYSFNDYYLQNTYDELVSADNQVRSEIINSYKNWVYDYNTINWIVKNYKTFISYTNDFFYFSKLIDKKPYLKDDIEIQDWLLKSYKNSQIYYKKVKSLVAKKK